MSPLFLAHPHSELHFDMPDKSDSPPPLIAWAASQHCGVCSRAEPPILRLSPRNPARQGSLFVPAVGDLLSLIPVTIEKSATAQPHKCRKASLYRSTSASSSEAVLRELQVLDPAGYDCDKCLDTGHRPAARR